MKKQPLLAATLGALILMPVVAQADNTTTTTTTSGAVAATLSANDKDFITKASQGGMIEIQTSKLAKKVSTNDSVKVFAQTMIDDHTKASKKLSAIAKKLGATVPKDLDTEHKGQLDQLKAASVGDFDQKFIAIQDKDHNEAVNAFQKEASTGDDPQLKSFAAKTLPTLQGHLEMVKQLETKFPPAATSGTK